MLLDIIKKHRCPCHLLKTKCFFCHQVAHPLLPSWKCPSLPCLSFYCYCYLMCLLLAVPPHQHKTIFTIKNELKKLFPTCCRLGKLLNEIVTIVTELKVNGLWFRVWGGLWWVQWKVVCLFLIQGFVTIHSGAQRLLLLLVSQLCCSLLGSLGLGDIAEFPLWVRSTSTMSFMTHWFYSPLHSISFSSIQSLSSSSKKILCF